MMKPATDPHSFHRRALAPVAALGLALAATALPAQSAGPIFPEPFRIEHHLEQTDADGNRFVSEPVVDTYGGSWIVSERPDESRLVVDLARRELTEVRPDKGTYWTLSFDRFADLQRRLRVAQGLETRAAESPDSEGVEAKGSALGSEPDSASPLVVRELPRAAGAAARSGSASSDAAPAPESRASVRRLRVSRDNDPADAAVEVWVDSSVRLPARALAALESFESALGGGASREAPTGTDAPGLFVAAARSHAQGAIPVRTARPVALSEEGVALGRIEDVATRLERLEELPRTLIEIPEGFRRVAHPLEAAVRYLEEEREIDRAMSGATRPGAGR
jgi:hypothetical protein